MYLVTHRAPTTCNHYGCGAVVQGRYCAEHTVEPFGAERDRGNRHARGYGYQWQKKRRAVLIRDRYLCLDCYSRGELTTAAEVDHIVAKAHGGTDAESNLQSLCVNCHKAKTQADARSGAARFSGSAPKTPRVF